MQASVAQVKDEQETDGGHHRTKGAGRWWQWGAGWWRGKRSWTNGQEDTEWRKKGKYFTMRLTSRHRFTYVVIRLTTNECLLRTGVLLVLFTPYKMSLRLSMRDFDVTRYHSMHLSAADRDGSLQQAETPGGSWYGGWILSILQYFSANLPSITIGDSSSLATKNSENCAIRN